MRRVIPLVLFLSLMGNLIQGIWLFRTKSQSASGAFPQKIVPDAPESIALVSSPAHIRQRKDLIAPEVREERHRKIDLPWDIARHVIDKLPCDSQLQITDSFAELLAMEPHQRRELQASIDREVQSLRALEVRSVRDFTDAAGRPWKRIPPQDDAQVAAHERLLADSARVLGQGSAKIFCDRLVGQSILRRDTETTAVSCTSESGNDYLLEEHKWDNDELTSVSKYSANSAIAWRYKHLFPDIKAGLHYRK